MDYKISAVVDTDKTLTLSKEVSFKPATPRIGEVVLKPISGGALNLVSTVEANSEEEAAQVFELLAQMAVSTLSLTAGVPVIEVQITEVVFKKNGKLHLSSRVPIKAKAHISIGLGEDKLESLGRILESALSNELDSRTLHYQESRKETESSLRYIKLYDILERECKDSKNVDDWLVRNGKATYFKCQQLRGKSKDETVLTHIRHCLHHSDHGQATPQEVESGVEALDTIVRGYLADKIPWLELLL